MYEKFKKKLEKILRILSIVTLLDPLISLKSDRYCRTSFVEISEIPLSIPESIFLSVAL